MGLAMDQVAQVIDRACLEFREPATRAQAEQVLLQFRHSPRPFAACQHILQHSAVLDSKFHAACAIREALVREWALLSPEEVAGLQAYILQTVLQRAADSSMNVVRSVLTGTFAVLVKRRWGHLEPEAKAAVFQQLEAAAAGMQSPAARKASIELINAMLQEFQVGSASPLGLSLEYHERCHRDLEAGFLRSLFMHAVQVASQAVQSEVAMAGQDAGTCAACMTLLGTILGWDFKNGTSGSGSSSSSAGGAPPPQQPQGSQAGSAGSSRRSTGEALAVKAGQDWAALLLAAPTTDWLHALLPSLRGRQAGSSIASAARHLVVALCSLPALLFPKRDPQQLRLGHLRSLLRAVLLWVVPAGAALHQAAAGSEEELVDACRALAALTQTHKAPVLQQAAAGLVEGPAGIFGPLQQLTEACLGAGGVGSEDSEPWLADCTDMLLEAWAGMLQPDLMHCYSHTEGEATALPAAALEASVAVFRAAVDASLRGAAAGASEEVTDQEEEAAAAVVDECMAQLASIARVVPQATFPHLCALISAQKQALQACAASGADPSAPLEALCWLLRMAAFCLADSGAGETPLVPEQLLQALAQGAAPAIEQLSGLLLEMAAACLQEGARALLSPRLMEAAVWAASRWCDTYLLPDEPLPEPLATAFGAAGAGPSICGALVQVATTCLAAYPGETELHKQVCCSLLPVLVRRPSLCQHLLQLDSWGQLAAAFAGADAAGMQHLHQKLHRSLATSLCMAAAGLQDGAQAQHYVMHVMGGTAAALSGIAQQPNLKASAGKAEVQLQTSCLLERLRGCALATLPCTQAALFQLFAQLLQPLLLLQSAFQQEGPLVTRMLKLASAVVESQVSSLEPPQAEVLMRWVLELLRRYTASGLFRASLHTVQHLASERAADQCKDLRAVLQLLVHLTQRDVVDSLDGAAGSGQGAAGAAAAAGLEQPVDVAQVVLAGLNIVLPLISSELLKYPKLCQLYFSLLALMLEVYPRQVACLQQDHFATLMSTLEFGLLHSDGVVAQCALEGLAGLAKFQLEQSKAGGDALARHAKAGGKTVAAHFLEVLLRRLLLDDTPLELTELAADALLPLALLEPAAFQAAAQALVAGQQEARTQAAVSAALMRLQQAGAAAAAAGAGRPGRRAFRESLCMMVADVRGLIRTR